MTTNNDRSRLARLATLQRDARRAEADGRLSEAAALLQEVARLDPNDVRTLHHLGELYRTRLNRPRPAASWYAREARCHELDGAHTGAIAVWRLVARCDPTRLEAYERIGALYVELNRLVDARQHFEAAAREFQAAGLAGEAAILRAQLAAMVPEEEVGPGPAAPTVASAGTLSPPKTAPDAEARDLAAERFQNARLFHHYGLELQARGQLENLLTSLPDHAEARQLLVEVCRTLGDADAAARHLRVLTDLLRREGQDGGDGGAPTALPSIEEWQVLEAGLDENGRDLSTELMESIREDVERVVEGLKRNGNGR